MAEKQSNNQGQVRDRLHWMKQMIAREFGIDYGDIATLGVAGLIFYLWQRKGRQSDALDTKTLIDEATFFRMKRWWEAIGTQDAELVSQRLQRIHDAFQKMGNAGKFRDFLFGGIKNDQALSFMDDAFIAMNKDRLNHREKWERFVENSQSSIIQQCYALSEMVGKRLISQSNEDETKGAESVARYLIDSGYIEKPVHIKAKERLERYTGEIRKYTDSDEFRQHAERRRARLEEIRSTKKSKDWSVWFLGGAVALMLILLLIGLARAPKQENLPKKPGIIEYTINEMSGGESK